jgi:hypothetical protein
MLRGADGTMEKSAMLKDEQSQARFGRCHVCVVLVRFDLDHVLEHLNRFRQSVRLVGEPCVLMATSSSTRALWNHQLTGDEKHTHKDYFMRKTEAIINGLTPVTTVARAFVRYRG